MMTLFTSSMTERPPSSGPRADLVHTLPLAHHPTSAAAARRAARDLMRTWGLGEDDTHDILTVVSELVTNAVEHARPPVSLHLSRNIIGAAHSVLIDVTDGGCASAPDTWSSQRAPEERGRGETVINALAARTGKRTTSTACSHWALMYYR